MGCLYRVGIVSVYISVQFFGVLTLFDVQCIDNDLAVLSR